MALLHSVEIDHTAGDTGSLDGRLQSLFISPTAIEERV